MFTVRYVSNLKKKIQVNLSPKTVDGVICSSFISRQLSPGPSSHLNEASLRATLAFSVVNTSQYVRRLGTNCSINYIS